MGWPPGRGEACWDAPDPTSPQSAGQSQQAGTCPLGADKIPWEAVCGGGRGACCQAHSEAGGHRMESLESYLHGYR